MKSTKRKLQEPTEPRLSKSFSENNLKLRFDLTPRQSFAFESIAQEEFFGGAAGGGKSHLARVCAITWCCEMPGLQVYFFRRYSDDLKLNHLEGPTGFRSLLARWCAAKKAEVIESEIRFFNGSKIFLRSCQYERDLPRVLGPEIHVLFLEECGQFLESMIRFIRGRLRIPDELKIPEKYLLPKEYWTNKNKPEYSFPKAFYTSNPGGPGHAYLKKGFVSGFMPETLHRAPTEDGGMLRCFIPAKLTDNPYIDQARYEANLKGLGSPQLVKALLLGDWDAVVGAFFPEIEKHKHLIEPFRIPDYWVRFMAMDWGACGEGDPFIIGWWTVSDGSIPKYPKNTLICYRIWNGSGMPKTTAMAVAQGIKDREFADGQIVYRVAGGDIGQERGTGPSIRELFANHGINFAKADQSRVSGWQQIRERLSGADSIPLIYWFKECENDLETMQNLQHDTNDPNDASQDNDHVAEMVRYACMSRPWSRAAEKKKPKLEELFKTPTIDQMWAERERLMKNLRH